MFGIEEMIQNMTPTEMKVIAALGILSFIGTLAVIGFLSGVIGDGIADLFD